MRSKDTAQQYERALQLLERQLEASQANLQAERLSRSSEREWFRQEFNGLSRHLEQKIIDTHLAAQSQLRNIALAQETIRSELAGFQEMAAIPTGDVPTVEELIEQAKADPLARKALEQTLQNLEFDDPLVGFN